MLHARVATPVTTIPSDSGSRRAGLQGSSLDVALSLLPGGWPMPLAGPRELSVARPT